MPENIFADAVRLLAHALAAPHHPFRPFPALPSCHSSLYMADLLTSCLLINPVLCNACVSNQKLYLRLRPLSDYSLLIDIHDCGLVALIVELIGTSRYSRVPGLRCEN